MTKIGAVSLFALMMTMATCLGCVRGLNTPPVATLQVTGREAAAVSIRVVCTVSLAPLTTRGWDASGVALGDRYVLTAAHAVPAGGECLRATIEERFSNGVTYPLALDAVIVADDVARLVVTKGTYPHRYVLKVGKLKTGDVICIVAAEPERKVKCGRVLAFRPPPGDIEHDALTVRGNSGSGVYNRKGEIVGIVTHERHNIFQNPIGGKATALAPWGRRWLVMESGR